MSTIMTKILRVDTKWSIVYDDTYNDKPLYWKRHGERFKDFNENSSTVSLFYALLEAKQPSVSKPLTSEDDVFRSLSKLRSKIYTQLEHEYPEADTIADRFSRLTVADLLWMLEYMFEET